MRTVAKLSNTDRWTAVIAAVVIVAATAVGVAAVLAGRDTTPSGMGPGRMAHQGARVTSESDYLAEMVAHHREAVDAAGELARSDRAEMRAFGDAIVRTQSDQIRQMETWLRDWYPQQPAADYRPMMRDLSGLSGDELDRAFLRDMIGHHMAAVMMSQHLLRAGTEHDDVARLARSIRDDQHAEILRMQRWLAEWFDEDWRDSRNMM
ncbi:DUF305 domain-containing protein [Aeromicrobium sp.]|uniref:DUF305 domain-containing protein n=1 Tax=Aeromicrobium sp. TaxID=1871063 RepID=UPI002FCC3062